MALTFGTVDGRIESVALLGFGAGFGAALTSIIHHVRKKRFHLRMADSFSLTATGSPGRPYMLELELENPRDHIRAV